MISKWQISYRLRGVYFQQVVTLGEKIQILGWLERNYPGLQVDVEKFQ